MKYRIWRSSHSRFGADQLPTGATDETLTALQAYTEPELQRIAEAGFNAIWIHGILRNLVKAEPFPELGSQSEIQLTAMRELVARAAKFGLKVFIYMQPPRALAADDPFWKKHPGVRGEKHQFDDCALQCLCTSTPEVQQWLKNAGAALLKELPDLAGIILITASEFAQHCFSHRVHPPLTRPWHREITCPHCRKRTRPEVIAELITTIYRGVRQSSATAEVVAWNWSWEFPDQEAAIIDMLPSDVILMADFERGGYKDLLRRPNFYIDEYSLGYAGPSEKFQRALADASKKAMRCMAKVQIGTTHELGDVVSLPMIRSLYTKAAYIREKQLPGYMGCWNFGNALPSLNVEAFNFFLSDECAGDRDAALQMFIQKRFPEANGELLLAAWEAFDDAMFYFPLTISFLYFGVQNFTLAFDTLYQMTPTGTKFAGDSWLLEERGDVLSNAYAHPGQTHLFTLDEIIERVGKLAVAWAGGVKLLKKAFGNTTDARILDELGNAIICGLIWRSTENSYRIYQLRNNWGADKVAEFRRIVEDEIAILNEVLPWVERDSRQGYHIEAGGYMFTPDSIRQKIRKLTEYK